MKAFNRALIFLGLLSLPFLLFAGIQENDLDSTNSAGAMSYINSHLSTNAPGVANYWWATNNGVVFGVQPDGTILITNTANGSWFFVSTNMSLQRHDPYGGFLLSTTNQFTVSLTNQPLTYVTNILGTNYIVPYTGTAVLCFSNGQLQVNGQVEDMSVYGALAVYATNVSVITASNLASAIILLSKTNTAPYQTTLNPFTINVYYTNLFGQRIEATVNYGLSKSTAGSASFYFTNTTSDEGIQFFHQSSGGFTNQSSFSFTMSPNDIVLISNQTGGSILSSVIKR